MLKPRYCKDVILSLVFLLAKDYDIYIRSHWALLFVVKPVVKDSRLRKSNSRKEWIAAQAAAIIALSLTVLKYQFELLQVGKAARTSLFQGCFDHKL